MVTSDFERLYREHVDAVFRYAVRLVRRREVAEDITSDVFLALRRQLDRVEPDRVRPWLFTVARNAAVDHWRRHVRDAPLPAEESGRVPVAAPATVEAGWLFRSPALKPVHRACLVLRYVHDLERTEIGRLLGLTETQVKGHLQYARQLLRTALSAREHT